MTSQQDTDRAAAIAEMNAEDAAIRAKLVTSGGSIKPIFNVKDLYAARGDGVTDDTTAIQAALTAAAVAGGIVYLPVGTYIVSSSLTQAGKVTIQGAGPETVIKGVYASGTPYIIQNDRTIAAVDIGLRDLTIDRSGANAQHGVHYRNVVGITIDRVRVVGLASAMSGAIVIGGFTTPDPTDACSDVRVTRCYFNQTDNFCVQLAGVTNGVIANNVAEDCWREVYAVEPGTGLTASNITIVGNVVRQGTTKNVGSSSTGLIIVTTSSGGTIDGVAITGNTVTCATNTAGDISPGINILGGTDVTVTGNIVTNTNGAGISIGNASIATEGVSVVGNTVRNGGNASPGSFNQVGINLRNAFQTSIIGNYVKGVHHIASVEETNGASSNIIANNQLLDATPVILLAGSHTALRGNQVKRLAASLRIATAASYTATGYEEVIAVTSTSSARTITLPAANAVAEGVRIVVKDESGAAATNNITIARAGSDTIDGATSLVISANYGKATIYSDGSSKWFSV